MQALLFQQLVLAAVDDRCNEAHNSNKHTMCSRQHYSPLVSCDAHHHFWHFFCQSRKQRTSLNVNMLACQRTACTQMSKCFIVRHHRWSSSIIAPRALRSNCGFQTSCTLILWITECWQCYRRGSVTACVRCGRVEATSDWQLVKHSADGHWSSDWSRHEWAAEIDSLNT